VVREDVTRSEQSQIVVRMEPAAEKQSPNRFHSDFNRKLFQGSGSGKYEQFQPESSSEVRIRGGTGLIGGVGGVGGFEQMDVKPLREKSPSTTI